MDVAGAVQTLPAAPSAPSEPSSSAQPTATPTAAGGDAGQTVDPAQYPTSASQWGEQVTGVRTRLATDDRVVALTFDACGGANGNGYDEKLIEFLIAEEIPATLFFNQRWIEANEDTFVRLADNPLFEVGNHGTEHRPLSVTGREAYGLNGTADPAAVVDEVVENQTIMTDLAGQAPEYFRAGTAYYDEVAVEIVNDIGLEVVGFDVLGDAGATYTAPQVAGALESAQPGTVALLHMNHPGSGTAQGVEQAVQTLRDRDFDFVPLSDYPLE